MIPLLGLLVDDRRAGRALFCLNFESAQLRPAFIVWEPVK